MERESEGQRDGEREKGLRRGTSPLHLDCEVLGLQRPRSWLRVYIGPGPGSGLAEVLVLGLQRHRTWFWFNRCPGPGCGSTESKVQVLV